MTWTWGHFSLQKSFVIGEPGDESFIFKPIKFQVPCISFKNCLNSAKFFLFFSYSAFVFLSITYHKWLWNANGNFNILPEKSLLSKSTSLLGWCSIFHSATNNVKLSSITQQGSLFFQPPEPIFSLLYQISPLVS